MPRVTGTCNLLTADRNQSAREPGGEHQTIGIDWLKRTVGPISRDEGRIGPQPLKDTATYDNATRYHRPTLEKASAVHWFNIHNRKSMGFCPVKHQ
jgi:hypothetical protein